MAISATERDALLRLLAASASPRYVSQRSEADQEPDRFIYHSPMRPFWVGFDREVETAGGFAGYSGGMRMVETQRSLPVGFLGRFELVPVSTRALNTYAEDVSSDIAQIALMHPNRLEMSVAWVSGSSSMVSRFDVRSPGEPVLLAEDRTESLSHAVTLMTHQGYSRYCDPQTMRAYLDAGFEARRLMGEVAAMHEGHHHAQGSISPSSLLADLRSDDAFDLNTLAARLSAAQGPDRAGLPDLVIKQLVEELVATSLPEPTPANAQAKGKRRWVDLSEWGVFLADQRLPDGKVRLVVVDMEDRGSAQQLAEIGLYPITGSPRYEKGIYFLAGEDQRLKPKALARAFGIEYCPLVDIEPREILRVFREKVAEKTGANLHAVTLRSRSLGSNQEGQNVFESASGRFIRLSEDRAVSEDSQAGQDLGKAAFLRAMNDTELRACASGFVNRIHGGEKTNWADLVSFGRVVFASGRTLQEDPTAEQLLRLQEAVEASAYRRFAQVAQGLNEQTFKTATDYYYGMPTARMRSSESVFLQQYSTPLPMSVVAQRLVIGADPLDAGDASLLEPAAGNGGLVSLLPSAVKAYGVELDSKRLGALKSVLGERAVLGDATSLRFAERLNVPGGFDYTLANPPFGQMDAERSFDKLNKIGRIDHFIGLRALEARKDLGRSVLIFGADSAQSDGEVKGRAKHFLNYIHDHYEVEGLAEIDGRLYSRNGSAYNVRMMVIGERRAVASETQVPERLDVITSYDDLWRWADHVIEKGEQLRLARQTPPVELRVDGADLGPAQPVFDEHAQPIVRRPSPAPVVQRETSPKTETAPSGANGEASDTIRPVPVSRGGSGAKVGIPVDVPSVGATTSTAAGEGQAITVPLQPQPEAPREAGVIAPWMMTQAVWLKALDETRPGNQVGGFTRSSGNAAAENMRRAEFLRYGVTNWASEKIDAAQRGHVVLTQAERDEVIERLESPVTHRDVILKAMGEGKKVPAEVLADYPDFTAPVRRVNEFQAPYQPASRAGEPSAMVPINMAGATYAALNDLESRFGGVDQFVAQKLRYTVDELPGYFSPEQVDAVALAIKAVEEGRGIINADQTGLGKGRFVAAMLRYAKVNERLPVFLTIKPELFTDIFRDISDIGSQDLFKKLFIFNDGENVKRYGTEKEVLYRATTPQERKAAIAEGAISPDTDMVLATYSQFMRAYEKNPKAGLLTKIAANNAMLILDEAHVASGASNLAASVGEAVANSGSVVYASATPLKGVTNFAIYNKVFPASVDLLTLPETLKAGGEALQEAISTNMARDGVLIRREHDFSHLTFHTRNPEDLRRANNVVLANDLSEILAGLSYLSGDVSRVVAEMNKGYSKEWEDIPDSDRHGARMKATSMNFGSRLYSLNRQFLLGIKIEDAVEASLTALQEGRKPVIAVENTGEALLRQVISKRLGIDTLEAELLELDEAGALTTENKTRREDLVRSINMALQGASLDEPPQYRELLESMLDRIGVIKVQGRYGDVSREAPQSEEYHEAAEALREKIRVFPDLPLTPIDVIKKQLAARGHPVAEVSGRTASLTANEFDNSRWDVKFHSKSDAVANVAGFQNGKFDAIVITRSGSTGISLHATDRFDDSDIRQRDFIVLQKAANIAEFLQWMGRVNRKDQVVSPVITSLESGLPAEARLTMMHNAKLRKLSANTTSNRNNANLEGEDLDLLNDVGDRVALEWLTENPDVAGYLDIALPDPDDVEDLSRFSQESPYINKLMGRLMMVNVSKQEEILRVLGERFAERLDELEQRGENPFKVNAYDWKAKAVKEEELHSGVIRSTGSTFDAPVKVVTLRYEQDIFPIRSDRLKTLIEAGHGNLVSNVGAAADGSLQVLRERLIDGSDAWVRDQLPSKLRDSEAPLSTLLEGKDVAGAKVAKLKAEWLVENVQYFVPGRVVEYDDLFQGERTGVITSVSVPEDAEEIFLPSKYRARVAFPGDDTLKDLTLASVRAQGRSLRGNSHLSLSPGNAERLVLPFVQRQIAQLLGSFDEAPDGKVVRTQYVLQGNIFRACELAHTQRLGAPILFTDEGGDRHRGVLLRDRITPEVIKSLPIGLDAKDMADYIAEYLSPAHANHAQRAVPGGLEIHDEPVKERERGKGLMLTLGRYGDHFILSMPGTKAKSGSLMADGLIFDIGEKTPVSSMRVKLTGTRALMSARIPMDEMPELLERLQRGRHLGKFYLPRPDQDTLAALKARFEQGRESSPHDTKDAPSI